ncbi:MAG: GFA family protein [Lysobacteraceae bacterium]
MELDGGCDCGQVRYRLSGPPLIVHCCHCRWCQRESGTAFALNALIESDRVTVLQGEPVLVDTPSESGKGQLIARCPDCHIAVWSHYAGGGRSLSFIRVGSLDDPDRLPPDIHIFAASKQPWLQLPGDTTQFPAYYDLREVWSEESQKRLRALKSA